MKPKGLFFLNFGEDWFYLNKSAQRSLLRWSRLSHEIGVPKSTQGVFSPGKSVIILPRCEPRVGPLCGDSIVKGCHERSINTFVFTAVTYLISIYPLITVHNSICLVQPILIGISGLTFLPSSPWIDNGSIRLVRFVFCPRSPPILWWNVVKNAIKIFWRWEWAALHLRSETSHNVADVAD